MNDHTCHKLFSRVPLAQVIPTRLSDGQVVLLLPNNKNHLQLGAQQGNSTSLYCLAAASNIVQDSAPRNSNYVLNVIDLPGQDEETSRAGVDPSTSPPYPDQPLDYTLHRKTQEDTDDGPVWRPW